MQPHATSHVRKLRYVRDDSWALTIPSIIVRELGWDNDTYVAMSASKDGRLNVIPTTLMRRPVPIIRKRDGATEAGMLYLPDTGLEP